MPKIRNAATVTYLATVLAVCFSGNLSVARAQGPHALVVVTNALDEVFVKRIGDDLVRVETLFASQVGVDSVSYEACNRRIQDLRDFQILLVRGNLLVTRHQIALQHRSHDHVAKPSIDEPAQIIQDFTVGYVRERDLVIADYPDEVIWRPECN